MIKFRAADTKNKVAIVGLGLSEANLQRLRKDEPILVHLKELNLPYDVQIIIFYGRTEEEMQKALKEYGMLGPDTLVQPDTVQ